ncbi:MAG: hypothetical protein VXY93_13065, partial [Pseudomonadota bacterium]|nr:hypothetical protein [Pseudomonadota bacterium]
NNTFIGLTDTPSSYTANKILKVNSSGNAIIFADDDNTQLTTEQVQDIVGAMFSGNTETRISATYQDSDGTIDLVVDDMTSDNNTTYDLLAVQTGGNNDNPSIKLDASTGDDDEIQIVGGTNVTVTRNSDSQITISSTDTDTNTQLSTEQVQDIVGAMFSGNTETRISATYQDSDGTIDLVVDDMTSDNDTTYDLITSSSGSNVQLLLDASSGDDDPILITAGSNVSFADVTSTGFTINTQNDNTQLTTEQVQDIVGAMFSGNTETRITATYQDSDGTIDLVVDDQSSDNNTTYDLLAVQTGGNNDNPSIKLDA